MTPKTTREHIISLQGNITGLKRDVTNIKTNHLKHMHQDIDKLGGKVDKIYWVLLAAVGATLLTFLDKIIT
jgi:hypothetical protein|tara:strand:+ start:322 stop:534 length:213 start_codon:yes stop_codon:yes gene_type:complete